MKIIKIFIAVLLLVPFVQSCQDDVSDTGDPRDAIAKKWRVVDNSGTYAGTNGYDVTISKDAVESTQVLFTNFHNLGTSDKLKAQIVGNTLNIITPNKLDDTYAITGSGKISSNLKSIIFTYSVKEGDDPSEDFEGTFGEVVTLKKKAQ